MWKTVVALGQMALLAACSPQSTERGVGGASAMGGAGASSGGSPATAGAAVNAGAGGQATNAGAGGQATITGPICPEEEPEPGSACTSTVCRYDTCDDGTWKLFSCREGSWRLTRACGVPECPPERPPFLSDCAPLEGIQCPYVEDCCGAEPATQTVVMGCESSLWTVLDAPDEACSFCRVHHEEGATCDQPSACSNVGCYRISCYSQPQVEECVDGRWHSQTLCSK